MIHQVNQTRASGSARPMSVPLSPSPKRKRGVGREVTRRRRAQAEGAGRYGSQVASHGGTVLGHGAGRAKWSAQRTLRLAAALASITFVPSAAAQYEVVWYTVDGGGVTFAEGGGYKAGGTASQADAGTIAGAAKAAPAAAVLFKKLLRVIRF